MPRIIDIKEYARQFHSGEAASCPSFEQEPSPQPKPPIQITPKEIKGRKGYVYYVGDGHGRIKIGFSANPWSRVSEMRCFNPSVEVLAVEKDDGTYIRGFSLEKMRQQQFKDYHLALEWFRAEDGLLDWIGLLNGPHDIMKRGADFEAKDEAS